jgi:ATP-binding cassette, subfamily B, bacterial
LSDAPTTASTAEPATPARRRHWRTDARLVALYARREPKLFTLAVTGSGLFALLTVGWSRTLGRVVDRLITPLLDGDAAPSAVTFARENKVALLLLLGGVGWMRLAAALLRRINAARLAHRSAHTWRGMVVDHLVRQPLAFYRRTPTGTLLGNADNDPEAATAVLHPLPYALGVVVLIVVALGWLVSVDVPMAIVSAIVLPLTLLLNERFQSLAEGPNEAVQQDVAELAGVVHETVDGISAVKALGLEQHMTERAQPKIERLRDHKLQIVRLRSTVNVLEGAVPQFVTVALVLIGAWRVDRGAMSVGDVVAVVSLYNLLVWPLLLLAWAMFDMVRSRTGLARLEALLADPPPPMPRPSEPIHSDDVLDLRNVSLVHDDGRHALDDVSVRIARNRVTAVVGATGSGKSSLLHVLAGLDPPTTGVRGTATSRIAMVFQEPLVLSGTIDHNLALGQPLLDTRVDDALATSGADEFVDTLADGRRTRLGERGVSLSGGQRQRLALARALAQPNDVILLDDTTSALDAETEARILRSLRDTNAVPTMVLVASRPSTISYADHVIVMDAGRVVAEGTHEELRDSSSTYRSLVDALAHA